MTAQIEDIFYYKRQEHSLVAISDDIGFKPQMYGIKPSSVFTACWAGYWCEYSITTKGLFLKNLYIHSKNEKYPPINGVEVTEVSDDDWRMGHNVYKNLKLPMKYTGKILLGNDFISRYYIHMGYQRSWAYKHLYEFEFKDGKLINRIDLSDTAAKQRAILDASDIDPRYPDGGDIFKFVEDSFSLDYSVKAQDFKIDEAN